jgi:hypothetical protein
VVFNNTVIEWILSYNKSSWNIAKVGVTHQSINQSILQQVNNLSAILCQEQSLDGFLVYTK